MSNLGGKTVSEDTDKDNQGLDTVVAGTNIDNIDATDPRNPIINASAQASGQVDSVVGGTNCSVDATDPVNPIVNVTAHGQVDSVAGGTNCSVDATDPINPIVNADTQTTNTTKGDLEGFSTVAARIPIGTNGQHLEADSTQALGLKWATPAAGGGAPSAARITRTSDESNSTTNFTPTFTTEVYDDNDFATLGTDADRLTVPSGVTRVNIYGNISIKDITDNTQHFMSIQRFNSSDVFQETVGKQQQDTASVFAYVNVAVLGVPAVAGDYFIMAVFSADSATTTFDAQMTIQDVSP